MMQKYTGSSSQFKNMIVSYPSNVPVFRSCIDFDNLSMKSKRRKLFSFPTRRLSDVLDMLSSSQPSCPQLYIYSSADRVIPANSVESFIEEQRRAGREVRACNFVSTPHVDHYRNDPKLYSSQLSQFLADCVLTSCCRESC